MIPVRHVGTAALCIMITGAITLEASTEAEARAITREYDRAYQRWLFETRMASDTRSLDQSVRRRPDPAEYGAKLKTLLNRNLSHGWTLEYGAWLLENDPALKPESQRALLSAVERNHTLSSLVGRFCVAMTYLNNAAGLPRRGQLPIRSRGMRILEQIKKNNLDPKVQGQAALALSIMLGNLGDDKGVTGRRLKHLREAIEKSADVRVGKFTVADIARNELYKIKHLSRGRVAPDITGTDSSSRPMKLSDFRGKVVILVFWSSWDTSAAKSLKILRKSASIKMGTSFMVLGVNRDSLLNLRALEADRITTWRNFSDPGQKIAKAYRVGVWPYCLVLDQNGVIRYRGTPGSFADAVADDLLRTQKLPVS